MAPLSASILKILDIALALGAQLDLYTLRTLLRADVTNGAVGLEDTRVAAHVTLVRLL